MSTCAILHSMPASFMDSTWPWSQGTECRVNSILTCFAVTGLRPPAEQEHGTHLAGPSRMTWRPAGGRRTPPQTKASSRTRHLTIAGMSGSCLCLASSSRSEITCTLVTGMYARTRMPLYAGCVLWIVYIVYRAPACTHHANAGQRHFGKLYVILHRLKPLTEDERPLQSAGTGK